jgi:polyketide cyclase/dehydrase/lipid transport protein
LDVVMAEISRSRRVAANPDAVWAVLADFGSLSRWADGVDHSCLLNADSQREPLGLSRRIQCGRDTFVETVTAFESPRSLAYVIVGVPRAFSVSNRWKLEPRSGGATTVTLTMVTLTTTIQAASPLPRPLGERVLARLMGKRSEILLSSLATALGGNP